MNLGELYIKISTDTSGIDSLKRSFESAAQAAESAGKRIDSAFGGAKSGASGAASSTDDFGKALEQAAAKGKILADAIEGAFSLAINLAEQAARAIGGFFQDAVGQFAAYQQNLDSLNITFGKEAGGEFIGWMQENSAALGMSMNQMMEHANKTGTLLNNANAKLREQQAAGEQQSTEQQKQELDNRLSNLRASLSNQLSETREAQSAEYDSWKEYYSNVLSELKDNLQAEYDALKDSLDARVKEQQKANERELRERTQALDDSYQKYKDSLAKELDQLKDSLSDRIDAQREANERELRETERTLEDVYEARKRELDAEVDDFTDATNERIRQINREYTEQYKLIDEEKYQKLKAIQDRIDAIDDERKANKRLAEDAKNNSKLQQLQGKLSAAASYEQQVEIQQRINDLYASMEQQRYERSLSDQKDALKEEKENVEKYYDDMKDSLKEQQKSEVDNYKDFRAEQLEELKLSNADKLKEVKRANQDEITELKNSQKEKIERIQEENQQIIKQRQERNELLLKNQKRANDEELRQLREAQEAQIDAMRTENSNILKEKQRSNNQIIQEQSSFNKQQLDNLKSAQNAEIREIQEHNRQRLQEEQNYINEQKKLVSSSREPYAEVTPEDRKKSIETLKKLYMTAADIGAARNMTTDQVLNILESVNYGRYATLDNLGLGYANKTGLQNLVADMNEAYQQSGRADHVLNAEDFNDVTEALTLLIEKYGFVGKAANEAKTTVSGSLNALQATWSGFITALGTEDKEDDAIFLKKLMGDGDEQGTVEIFLSNVIPVIERIVQGLTEILTEYGPQIAEAVAPLIDMVVQSAAGLIKTYGPTIASAVVELFGMVHDALPEDTKNMFDGIKTAVEVLAGVFAAFMASQAVLAFSSFFTTLTTEIIPPIAGALGEVGAGIELLGESLFAAGTEGVAPFGETLAMVVEELTGLGPEAGPIGAIIALIVAMIANSENLRNVLGDIITTIGGGLMSVLDALSPILDLLVGLWNKLMEAAKALGDFIAQVFGPMWERLKETLGPPLQDVIGRLKDIFEKVKDIVLKVADAIGKVLGPVLNALGSVLGPIFELLGSLVGGILGTLLEVLAAICEGPLQAILSLLGFLVDIVGAVFGKIGEFINWLLETGKPAIEAFGSVIDAVTNFFKGLGEQIKKALDDPLKWLEEAGRNTVEGFKNGLNEKWEELKSWVTEQFRRIAQTICDVLGIHSPSTVLEEIGKNTIEGFKEGVSGDVWEGVKNFFGGIGENLKGAMEGAGSWLTEKGKGVIDGLKGGIDTAWTNVQSFFGGVNQNVQEHFNGSDKWLDKDGNDIINGMQEGITNAFNNVQSFFGGINGEILQHFNDSDYWLNGDGKNIIDGLNSGITQTYDTVNNFFGGIPDSIAGFFSNATDWLFSNGQNIISGLYDGLVDAWNNHVVPFVSGIGDWIHNNDGPEREDKQVLYDNGKWFIEGLAKGMRDAFPMVEDAVSDMVGLMDVGNPTISLSGTRRSQLLNKEKPINVYMTYNAGEDAQELVYDMVGQLRRYGYTMGGRG